MQKKNPDASPYQPESVESQLPLDGSISESTPSISAGEKSKAPTITDRSREQFSTNPLFGADNPNSKKNKKAYTDHLSSLGYPVGGIELASREADRLSGVEAKASQEFAQQNNLPEGFPKGGPFPPELMEVYDKYVGTLKESFMEGNRQINEAFSEVPEKIKELADPNKTIGEKIAGGPGVEVDLAHPILKATTGTITAVLSPVIAAFETVTEGIRKTAEATLPEEEAEVVGGALPYIFSLGHKAAESLGYKPEADSNGDHLLGFLDFIVGGRILEGGKEIGAKGIKVGKEYIKSVDDLKVMSEKASKGELSPEEMNDFKSGMKEIEKTSVNDIKEAAEGADTPLGDVVASKVSELSEEVKSPSVEVNDLNKKIEELRRESPNETIVNAIEELKGERDAVIERDNLVDISIAETEAMLTELRDTQERLEGSQSEMVTDAGKEAYTPKIDAVKKEISDIIEPKIEKDESIRKQETEGVPVQPKAKGGETVSKAPKEKVKEEVIEPLVDEARADVKAEKEGLEFKSEEEFDRYIAENSNSAVEIAETFLRDEVRGKKEVGDLASAIEEQGIKITEEDFAEYGDINNLDKTAKKYIDKDATPLDKQLKSLEGDLGREVTTDEFIDYISGKQRESFIPKETELKTKLRSRYKEVTKGGELSPSAAAQVLASEGKRLFKEKKVAIEKEGAKAEKLKEESEADIKAEKPAAPKKQKDIGVSEKARAAQRKELGIPELPKIDTAKESWKELNAEADKLVDSGKADPLTLAREINEGKKETSTIDTAVLNRGVVDIDKNITNARYERRGAAELGDKTAEKKASDDWFAAVSELAEVHSALEVKGSKAAKELVGMKMSKLEDYSLGNLHQEFKKANKGKDLPIEILERIDEYAVEIAELDAKVKEQEAQLKKQGVDIEELKTRRVPAKEKIAKIREKRSKLFKDWKKASEDAKKAPEQQGLGISDKDIEFAAKIVASYIEEGVVTTMAASKKLKRDVKEAMGIKLSDKDVADILDFEIDGEQIRKNLDDTELAGHLEKNKRRREKAKQNVQNEKAALEYINKTKTDKFIAGIIDVANVPRSLMASFDFSAPLRQGLVATIAHPKSGALATKEMFKQAFSQKNFDNWLIDYKQSPDYALAKKSDLYVADPMNLHEGLKGREEAFMSNIAENLPLFIGKGIKMSERAYVGYLNKLRTDVFKNGAEEMMSQGMTFEKNPEVFKGWADFVNNSTGRGKLPTEALEKAAPLLNAAFFSPRLIASRLNTLNPRYYAKMPRVVWVKALKDMGKFVGLTTSILAILKASGADVEGDPRSSDFGKIKVGNARYDILGGYQQYLRVATQFTMGEKKSTTTGRVNRLNPYVFPNESRWDLLGRFARYKLSPAVGLVVNTLSGKDPMGMPATVANQLYSNLTPLQLQGALEAYEDGGYARVVQTVIPSMFGIGVQVFDSRRSSIQRKRAMNRAIRNY